MNMDGVRVCPTRDRCIRPGDRHDDWQHVDRETGGAFPVEAWEVRYFDDLWHRLHADPVRR